MVPLWGLISIRRTGSVPKLPTTSRPVGPVGPIGPVGPVGPCSSVPKQGSAHPLHLATKLAWLWPIKWLKLHMYMGRLLGKETIATYIHFRMLRVPPWKSCICTSFMRLFACQKLEIFIYLFFSCLFVQFDLQFGFQFSCRFGFQFDLQFGFHFSLSFSICFFFSSIYKPHQKKKTKIKPKSKTDKRKKTCKKNWWWTHPKNKKTIKT